jgi:hypothetical protein
VRTDFVSAADTDTSPDAAPAPAATYSDAECPWYAQNDTTTSPRATVIVLEEDFKATLTVFSLFAKSVCCFVQQVAKSKERLDR